MKPIFIFGTGGHARDVADVATAAGWQPVFVARDAAAREAWTHPFDIVSEEEALARGTEGFAIGIGDNRVRANIARLHRGTLRFPSLIHPDTSFGHGSRDAAENAEGSVIFAGVRMTNAVRIGRFCTINLGATVSHDVELGDFANLSPGAHIAGNVRIGEGAWIGLAAGINQGNDARKLEIGAWSVIGSGAMVVSDCEAEATYVGVPARKRQ
jgi:sugar O-acyltransferase (sialic acid O-acetyltransferase NeuD family)